MNESENLNECRHVFVETKHLQRLFNKSKRHAQNEMRILKKHFNIKFPQRLKVCHLIEYYGLTYDELKYIFVEPSKGKH
ncbi:MAG: hypothetical protein ACO1N7_08805 [Sphingobacteriaceae bacterium]